MNDRGVAQLAVEIIPCEPSKFLVCLAELQAQARDVMSENFTMMGGVPPEFSTLGQDRFLLKGWCP